MFYSQLYICIYFKIIYLCALFSAIHSFCLVHCCWRYCWNCRRKVLRLLAYVLPFTWSINFHRIISKYMYIIIKHYLSEYTNRTAQQYRRAHNFCHCSTPRIVHSYVVFDLLFFLMLFICNFRYIILIFGASSAGFTSFSQRLFLASLLCECVFFSGTNK